MVIYPILLCGGSGTRLWPFSRKSFPKQFASLVGTDSLFQQAAKRLSGNLFHDPVAITTQDFRFIVSEQIGAIGIKPIDIVLEPEGRGTAASALVSAFCCTARDPNAIMLLAPTDQTLNDVDDFCHAVETAMPLAKAGNLVTFGIAPKSAETGYGYLELSEAVTSEPQKLVRFVEKPVQSEAAEMIASKQYLWNSGIFLFSAAAIIDAFKIHAPEIFSTVKEVFADAKRDLNFVRLAPQPWEELPNISIDYAIMEKADNLSVMPLSGVGWSDLGDWDAVWRQGTPDEQGNVCSSGATAIDCSNTLLRTDSDGVELVGVGLEGIVAIAMNDAVLLAKKDNAQQVRKAVARLEQKGIPQATQLPIDYRPWGSFENLAVGEGFCVKRITINPGGSLSLQSHQHRSEHWVVVKGTAMVTVDNDIRWMSENQSIYVPIGAKHRLENQSSEVVILIEVQMGSYLSEDDITRYDDKYGRG
ncbi:MAG: mannose-1-phosphate guanylyltransferase/mannose-6-phosphate isomerase [Aestuariivita sp.]|nr:mannose-1-phosphate guanylyltransferase/mannose-6-phosphate isomerase [Aestuariivita sp.]MCY4346115.1 mannose-1-phosphate guanylyltransferase/mannose-6-phosphate isomerase [Aestuariivita sp.]